MGVKSLKIYTGKFSPYDHFPKEPICTKTCMPILRQGNFLRKNFSFFFLNLKPPLPPPHFPLSGKQTNRQKNFYKKIKDHQTFINLYTAIAGVVSKVAP